MAEHAAEVVCLSNCSRTAALGMWVNTSDHATPRVQLEETQLMEDSVAPDIIWEVKNPVRHSWHALWPQDRGTASPTSKHTGQQGSSASAGSRSRSRIASGLPTVFASVSGVTLDLLHCSTLAAYGVPFASCSPSRAGIPSMIAATTARCFLLTAMCKAVSLWWRSRVERGSAPRERRGGGDSTLLKKFRE
jgi:hypothetical protein